MGINKDWRSYLMEDVINEICNNLVKNSHVIGILYNCECFSSVKQQESNTVNLCVISKEAGNVANITKIQGFVVHIRWCTDIEFYEWIKSKDFPKETCRILYDRTGLLSKTI